MHERDATEPPERPIAQRVDRRRICDVGNNRENARACEIVLVEHSGDPNVPVSGKLAYS